MPQKFQVERRTVNTFLKMLFYTHALRRFDKPADERRRDNLLILWADEAQRFVSARGVRAAQPCGCLHYAPAAARLRTFPRTPNQEPRPRNPRRTLIASGSKTGGRPNRFTRCIWYRNVWTEMPSGKVKEVAAMLKASTPQKTWKRREARRSPCWRSFGR